MRGATLFSGGGSVEARLKDCIEFVHAVEYDPAIADVYRRNHGDHIQVADVCDVDYTAWGALDYLHASPVCKNASQAKTGGEESETDIRTALAVVRCLEATQPRVFTLENVGGYARFEAYRRICRALDAMGYIWHAEVLNAADYGVPQTRRRLILRAVRDSLLLGLPAPLPWVGWYAAIEGIDLPKGELPQRLMPMLKNNSADVLINCQHTSEGGRDSDERELTLRNKDMPAPTILSSYGPNSLLAYFTPERQRFMTPRALARFQSIPDSFWLPDRAALACTVIGNAVPSLLMREVVRPLL